jgi:hypothetical protein
MPHLMNITLALVRGLGRIRQKLSNVLGQTINTMNNDFQLFPVLGIVLGDFGGFA